MGQLLAPAAEAFLDLQAQKGLIMLFWPILGQFWCSAITIGTFRSNLNNFEINPKNKIKYYNLKINPKQINKSKKSKQIDEKIKQNSPKKSLKILTNLKYKRNQTKTMEPKKM